jgi:hypothetical protein
MAYKRHGKSLTKKSRTHKVESIGNGMWQVKSGSSGKTYTIKNLTDGRFVCSCDWHKYHSAGECSHTLSVRQELADIESRKLHGYGSVEQYRKAHRKYEDYNDGLIIASRAA